MPRRPDLPCADCGTLMWRGKGVLPEGQARCRACRAGDKQRHGTATRYKGGCRCPDCREAKRVEMVEYVKMVRERDGISPSQKYRPLKVGRRPPGDCSQCGKALAQAASTAAMCTPCRRRSKRGIDIRPADRLAIYDRDGWTCGICSEPVDSTLSGHHQWGPTLDHIMPRSLGGSDEPTNLRLAHRACNSRRGARVEQEAS